MAFKTIIKGDGACWSAIAIFVICLLVLAVRLKEVQVDSAADFNYEKARQSERRLQTAGGRGLIIDCKGKVVAANKVTLSIVCNANVFQKKSWSATTSAVRKAIENAAKVIGLTTEITDKAISRHLYQTPSMPIEIWRDVDFEHLAKFYENSYKLKGFSVVESEERYYPFGNLAAHVIGYVGRDRGESTAGDEKFSFFERELKGRSGLESYYDSYLRGVSGERKLLVDARGFTHKEWVVSEATRGPNLFTTLDMDLQREVEFQLRGETGACVVMDPRDGSILAMASSPTFNLNEFVPKLSSETYNRYVKSETKPFLNRACGGLYAPGSTFKPITALAGLAADYPPEEQYFCAGFYEFGEMKLKCSSQWGHGYVNMQQALRDSCNAYFCQLAETIGTNVIVQTARKFGLGQKTGIDFGLDPEGVVPDDAWKRKTYGVRWFTGDLVQMSIGQGMLLTSPLQMAIVAGALGTGYIASPHLKQDLVTSRRTLDIPLDHLDIVRLGMRMVVDGGTGRKGAEGVSAYVLGKTGTAEIGRGANRRKNTWFIAYAEADESTPESNLDKCVAVAMVIENGVSGGGTTAPKVASVLRKVYNVQ